MEKRSFKKIRDFALIITHFRLIYWFSALLIFIPLVSQAQVDTSSMVRYTPEFLFNEGIFLTFDQVRNNAPIPKSRLITDVDYYNKDYFVEVLSSKLIYFYDYYGNRQEVKSSDIWGFSRNGILYILMDNEFFRITIVGRICHFVATTTTYENRYYDPYYYNPYYYDSYYRYGGYPSTYKTNEMRQYLLDFDTGEVFNYETKNMEVLLMKDPELHDEYVQLSNKKKKQLKFLYLRKFNEKNPLYIPVSPK
jgi:hypothetical protein